MWAWGWEKTSENAHIKEEKDNIDPFSRPNLSLNIGANTKIQHITPKIKIKNYFDDIGITTLSLKTSKGYHSPKHGKQVEK